MERVCTFALAGCAGLLLLASAAAVAQSSPPTVGQKERRFSEELVTVKPGGTVRFANDDSIAHNVYARDPAGTNQPGQLQKPGEQSDLVFAAVGEHQVLCAIHPRMRMTVRVQP